MRLYNIVITIGLGLGLCWPVAAQVRPADRIAGHQDGNNALEVLRPEQPYYSGVAAYSPLSLRNGAVPTKLWGFYDYQSNGKSPAQLWVDPANPQNIQVTYMLASDSLSISPSRRVGYAYSTDGGANWTANTDIGGVRLGFPHIQATGGNVPMIAAHYAPSPANELQNHIQLYVGSGPFQATGFVALDYPQPTASGRTNGVLWPAFVLNKTEQKAITVGGLSNPTGTGQAPLQTAVMDLNSGSVIGNKWSDLADTSVASTSGGRVAIARSAAGKIGVAYYHFGADADPVPAGLFFSESANDGGTWSMPQRVWGGDLGTDLNQDGNPDTARSGYQMDLTYTGETPYLTFEGTLNGLYATESIYMWTPARGVRRIATTDSLTDIGCTRYFATKTQPNMTLLTYPTISATADGQTMVVCFSAVASIVPTGDTAYGDENGFSYYRLWAVGSRNGGKDWSAPFLVQNFGGAGDSASIEYPSAARTGRMNGANYELSVVYQARRHPGMYAFTATNSDTGKINACYQYFQRMQVTPAQMAPITRVHDWDAALVKSLGMKSYPNPANTAAALEFTLPAAGSVSLSLFNPLGQEALRAISGERLQAGTFSRKVDLSALPAGTYRCVLTYNGVRTAYPLNIVR